MLDNLSDVLLALLAVVAGWFGGMLLWGVWMLFRAGIAHASGTRPASGGLDQLGGALLFAGVGAVGCPAVVLWGRDAAGTIAVVVLGLLALSALAAEWRRTRRKRSRRSAVR